MLAPDVSSLRESRDLRLVVLGNFVSGMGTQATLVALPYQVYTESHSALLVGLLGAVELVPLIVSAPPDVTGRCSSAASVCAICVKAAKVGGSAVTTAE